MNKLCRQVSIESPSPAMKDCVFNFIVPVLDTPPNGARILVVCAGACYRLKRSTSISSVSSISSEMSDISVSTVTHQQSSPAHTGLRDGALFPGFEVAGVIESLGSDVSSDCGLRVGQRIILYPYDGIPSGYSELIVVPELKYLIPIPDTLKLSVAAMLPTGALLAMNAVVSAHTILENLLRHVSNSTCKILIVGTGGLALWAVRLATHHFFDKDCHERVQITVASLRDEGILIAKECSGRVNVVQWSEDLYEKQLIERTHDACQGLVDVVIDFGTTSRSLHRSMQCLCKVSLFLIKKK